MRETRKQTSKRMAKATGPPNQVEKIARLLEMAQLEATQLAESDPHTAVLRQQIIGDLDAMLKNLRGTSVQAAESQLPDGRHV